MDGGDLSLGNDRLPNVTYSGNIRDEENKFKDKDLDNVKGDSDVEKVSETSGMQENGIGNDNEHSIHGEENIHSSDPFNIYELLQKKKDKIHQTKESDPTHPPGFTPELGNNNKEEGLNSVNDQRKLVSGKKIISYHNVEASTHHTTCMPITGGSILDVMNNLIKMLCGNLAFDHAVSSSVDYFLAIMGTWTPTSTKPLVILVYAPQELSKKRELWGYLCSLIDRWGGETVVLGEFNEVRMEQERFGSTFNIQGANAFNNFISLAGLLDLFPHLSSLCLDRHLSDHRPIIMFESKLDYGPIPFRMFHSSFKIEGFDKFVEDTWDSMNVMDSNGLIRMKKKLQLIKNAIKSWVKEKKNLMNEANFAIKCKLTEVDKLLDRG
ncbi:RNA-directed DNA polymerase, eukaryota [Tanacetum coccineum]